LKPFKSNDERTARTRFFRIASLIALIALIVAIGLAVRNGNTSLAALLVFMSPAFAVAFSWNWTGSLFAPFEWAKNYVQGVEGDHRHEWYAFKGQRVRVFLDERQEPWFAVYEIAFILALEDGEKTFRHYGPHEYGIPASASERCLSEGGLRRLIKYSAHPEAGALGIWLEREVLRVLRRKKEVQATGGSKQQE
jgi:hypothetical protein